MTALRWAGIGCRAFALLLCAYVVFVGLRPALDGWAAITATLRTLTQRHDVVIELRPRALIAEPDQRWI